MKTNYMTTIAILLAAVICVGMVYPLSRIAYAHTFSGGESASFLALSKQISSEVELAQSNIPSNITLAQITLMMHGNILMPILLKNFQNETKE